VTTVAASSVAIKVRDQEMTAIKGNSGGGEGRPPSELRRVHDT
jgi:hypothetical protein